MNSLKLVRSISTSCVRLGKKNFRKFQMANTRLNVHDKVNPEYVETYGQRMPCLLKSKEIIPELIPEIIVPNLEGFDLKPYVSYNVPDVIQPQFTAEDLFDAIYSEKIEMDFKENKLDEHGNPLEPSEEEQLTRDEAEAKARSSGSDIYG